MGIPYSREINAAFEQVTPLVAAGFKVLKTTKNISILLAVIQVLTVIFLAMILMVLLGIAYAVNPDLEVDIVLAHDHQSSWKLTSSTARAQTNGHANLQGSRTYLISGYDRDDCCFCGGIWWVLGY